jgi:hypothetical protein
MKMTELNTVTVMNVNKEYIIKLIQEEIANVMSELNPYHDKATGRLSSKKAGNTYSLTKKAVRKAKWKPDKAQKAIVTKKGNLRGKYGMPDTCGRKNLTGKDINPEKSCSKYPKRYSEADMLINDGVNIAYTTVIEIIDEVFSQLIGESEAGIGDDLKDKCRSIGLISAAEAQERVLRGVNMAVLAADGDLLSNKK